MNSFIFIKPHNYVHHEQERSHFHAGKCTMNTGWIELFTFQIENVKMFSTLRSYFSWDIPPDLWGGKGADPWGPSSHLIMPSPLLSRKQCKFKAKILEFSVLWGSSGRQVYFAFVFKLVDLRSQCLSLHILKSKSARGSDAPSFHATYTGVSFVDWTKILHWLIGKLAWTQGCSPKLICISVFRTKKVRWWEQQRHRNTGAGFVC
jgi:hypothetical protein